ncbi:MAG: NAD-dependent epimerase/dehydratase family protein [Lachnospiraceae bacterium]|nr:NAD-dependent epimerase/dehydratase family protein [Lachnospiraceae bacterium]
MNLYENKLYMEDVRRTASLPLPFEKLAGKRLLLSGATGLIGSFLTDVLMERNRTYGLGLTVIGIGRNERRARERFTAWEGDSRFIFVPWDINEPPEGAVPGNVDYILHLASNTHPVQYATDPIGTITTNLFGLSGLLQFACERQAERFAFASSNEVYGEMKSGGEFFTEDSFGYINCNTLRAGYPESKRCGEALCQAYRAGRGLEVVIPRLTRSYGPTLLPTDTKAISQFIKKGVRGEDIVLKSAGTQYYSYTYMADAVSGLLTVLLKGADGEAYNIADEASDITLRDLAGLIADFSGRKVVFELPDAVEAAGYSTATKARLDGSKLKGLGWRPAYDIKTGIERTITILRETGAAEDLRA